MRAAQIHELKAAPEPVEIDGGGSISIEAVALNPIDIAVGSGVFYGGHPPLPYVPGCEAVGRDGSGALVYLFGDGHGIAKPGFLAERSTSPTACSCVCPTASIRRLRPWPGSPGWRDGYRSRGRRS